MNSLKNGIEISNKLIRTKIHHHIRSNRYESPPKICLLELNK